MATIPYVQPEMKFRSPLGQFHHEPPLVMRICFCYWPFVKMTSWFYQPVMQLLGRLPCAFQHFCGIAAMNIWNLFLFAITKMCNNNGVRDCRELLEVSQQNVCEYIFYDEAIKSKHRNRMGGKTQYDSVREASAPGVPLIDICNNLLFSVVSMTISVVFPLFSFNCSESVIL